MARKIHKRKLENCIIMEKIKSLNKIENIKADFFLYYRYICTVISFGLAKPWLIFDISMTKFYWIQFDFPLSVISYRQKLHCTINYLFCTKFYIRVVFNLIKFKRLFEDSQSLFEFVVHSVQIIYQSRLLST